LDLFKFLFLEFNAAKARKLADIDHAYDGVSLPCSLPTKLKSIAASRLIFLSETSLLSTTRQSLPWEKSPSVGYQ
jgi:hypothetical protein